MGTQPDEEVSAAELFARLKGEMSKEAVYQAPDEISRASIRKYALAIGDFNPLYTDREFAVKHGLRDVMAPPTLLPDTWQYVNTDVDETGAVVGMTGPGRPHDFELFKRAVRAGNEYEFFQPVHPDDVITARWTTRDVYEKKGRSGPLVFQEIQSSFSNQRNDLLCVNIEFQLYRPVFDMFNPQPGAAAVSSRAFTSSWFPSSGVRSSSSSSSTGLQPREPKIRYFEDVQVGEKLPPFQKQFDQAHMMIYGAATWDFIRVHYDADYVRATGFEAPFVDGQMLGGILTQQVQDWAGPGAFLRKISFRNKALSYAGDLINCNGVVTNKYTREGENLVECDLWVDNQRGEKVVQPASAVVRFPRRSS